MKKKKFYSIAVDGSTKRLLKKYCRQQNKIMSHVIKQALCEYLKKEGEYERK